VDLHDKLLSLLPLIIQDETWLGGAGISQWYSSGLRVGLSGVRIPTWAGNFSLDHHDQTGSGAHPASYQMGIRGSFPRGKAAQDVKLTTQLQLVRRSRMRGAIPPLPQDVFMAWCLVKHRDNFIFHSLKYRMTSTLQLRTKTY
jgi:hypothetical protein